MRVLDWPVGGNSIPPVSWLLLFPLFFTDILKLYTFLSIYFYIFFGGRGLKQLATASDCACCKTFERTCLSHLRTLLDVVDKTRRWYDRLWLDRQWLAKKNCSPARWWHVKYAVYRQWLVTNGEVKINKARKTCLFCCFLFVTLIMMPPEGVWGQKCRWLWMCKTLYYVQARWPRPRGVLRVWVLRTWSLTEISGVQDIKTTRSDQVRTRLFTCSRKYFVEFV